MLPIRQHLLTLTCLKSTPKTVLVEVCELAENGGKGACFASNQTLADSLGMSKATVVRQVELLEEAGLLTSVIVKAEGNRRYLRPTPRLRACYTGGSEADQLAAASKLTIVKTAPAPPVDYSQKLADYSQNCDLTIVKSGADYSQNSSRVIGDDQYDQLDDHHDQRGAWAREREGYQKKIAQLESELAQLRAQTPAPTPPVPAAPLSPEPAAPTGLPEWQRSGHYRDFDGAWPEQLRSPFATAPAFAATWATWCKYLPEIGKRLGGGITEQQQLDKLSQLAGGDLAKALFIISDTISSNWKNLTFDESHWLHHLGKRAAPGRPSSPATAAPLASYGRNRGTTPAQQPAAAAA